jgi:uncharacterized FlaG/YvyC family protein
MSFLITQYQKQRTGLQERNTGKETMKSKSKIQVKEMQKATSELNSALHVSNVMVSFGIFKLRDLVSLKDCYKKT